MRIAVLGGGIFGCTAAIIAARAEHEVHLFEKSDRLMQAASAVNQFRLHRGYHYPRSMETGRQCRFGNRLFRAEYGSAVIEPEQRKHGGQFYAIAREGSKVSADEYLRFLNVSGLPYREVHPNRAGLDPASVSLVIGVLEASIDPIALQRLVEEKLSQAGVHLHLGYQPVSDRAKDFEEYTKLQKGRELLHLREYDQIIVAAYANTNKVAKALGCRVDPLQFEVCEKPVLKLPAASKDIGVVVMDGPFCSLDPYGKSGLHLMGHVEHAIHWTRTGDEAFDEVRTGRLRSVAALGAPSIEMNAGIIPNPPVTNIAKFIEDGSRFLPVLRHAEHVGSMFTVRVVLPNVDATDERPTMVERLDDQVVRIFSGKIGTAVDAAYEALFMMERGRMAA